MHPVLLRVWIIMLFVVRVDVEAIVGEKDTKEI